MRTVEYVTVTGNPKDMEPKIDEFMKGMHFRKTVHKGENVWKTGGFWTSAKMIKISYLQSTIKIEAFVLSFFGSEYEIDDKFVMSEPKAALKAFFTRLVKHIRGMEYDKQHENK